MKILLDACGPRRLRDRLSGHEVRTAPDMGWGDLNNGALLDAMAGQFDALVVDSAGCGAHLKDFYPALKNRVKDLSEWLAEAGLPEPKRDVKMRVTYQDACHLAHAQRIKKQPRDLIRAIPGVDWVEMRHADICCGAAGLYSTLEPDMSNRILQEKLDDLAATRADVVAVANPGCQMQLEAGLRKRGSAMKVLHVSELLARAY